MALIELKVPEITCVFEGSVETDEPSKFNFKMERSIGARAYSEHTSTFNKYIVRVDYMDCENYEKLKVLFDRFNNFSLESKDEFIYQDEVLITSDTLSLKRNVDKIKGIYYRTGNISLEEV